MAQPARRKPIDARFLRATLAARRSLAPGMVRVTLRGDELAGLRGQADDQWFRLFFRRYGVGELTLPGSPALWWPQYLAIPARRRPHVRTYTVRSHRPEAREIDVDVVVHDDGTGGPGMRWAMTAPIGDEVALLDQGCLFHPAHRRGEMLLAGDAAALPGIAAICEALPADARGVCLVAPGPSEAALDFARPSGVRLDVIERAAELPRAVEAAWRPEVAYAYACAEQSQAAGMRRALAKGRGMSTADITFAGFWREGVAAA